VERRAPSCTAFPYFPARDLAGDGLVATPVKRVDNDKLSDTYTLRSHPPAYRARAKGETKVTVRLHRSWTPEEMNELRLEILASKDIETIAKELGRTPKAIRRKASELKLTLKILRVR
jgi:hypothetical protein